MKVRAGSLTDADRALIFESNRGGRRVLIATKHGCVIGERCHEPMQAVGSVKGWTYEAVQIGGFSFTTSIPWESIIAVWWRDEAPSEQDVAALIAEHVPSPVDGERDGEQRG